MKELIEFYKNFEVPIIIAALFLFALPMATAATQLEDLKWLLVIAHILTAAIGIFIGIKAANDRV